MKNIYFLFYLCLLATLLSCSQQKKTKSDTTETTLKVSSYNIRFDAQADYDTGNGWNDRKGALAELITRHGFEIVGTQEGHANQLTELKGLLPGYDYVAHPYGGSSGTTHNCATFFKTDRFDVLDQGVFWFSQTPDIPSIGWDASDRRICHWTRFRENTSNKEFYLFNAHFYWRNKIAREESGPLLVRKVKEIAGEAPAIVVGDLNSEPSTPQMIALKAFLSDAYEVSTTAPQGPENTGFPGGVFTGEPDSRIDYIYVTPHFRVKDYNVLLDTYKEDRYPSDHLPVVAALTF